LGICEGGDTTEKLEHGDDKRGDKEYTGMREGTARKGILQG
jgi:hypothetical protein